MENQMHFTGQVDVVRHIMFDELKIWIASEVLDIADISSQQAIDANDFISFSKKAIREV
jgi:hypothetical protein